MTEKPKDISLVLALENSSSHIYLLKEKLKHYIDDYVEGFNVWEKRKSELIIEMAETLEKLHFIGEYQSPLNTISSHIRKTLRERGVSEYQLDYVLKVLPSKYKNPDLARDMTQVNSTVNNNNNNNNVNNSGGSNFTPNSVGQYHYQEAEGEDGELEQQQQQQQQAKPINIYELKKKIEQMTPIERQNYSLELEQKHKHIRNNMKAEKDVLEYLCIRDKTPLPRYKKVSSDVPPEHLHKWTVLYDRFELLEKEALDLHKYFKDIKQSIYEFPPDPEMAERNAKRVDIFINGPWKTIKEIFIAPQTDKKWSGDWLKWIDIHFTRLEQSKNYAGSKHALETGRFAWKAKDGQEFIFSLDRGITREQVGDKEPELFEMVKQMLIGYPMVQALHDWSYNTFIDEEYDEDGNPIITATTAEQEAKK